jgi:hypothetical protein
MSIQGVPHSGGYYELEKNGPYWPAGEYSCRHEGLCYLLYSSAQDNAARALSKYVSNDRLVMLQAAVAGGTAVEHAAKAVLVQIAPTLICDRSNADSLLHLSGKGELAEASAMDIKTISGLEAVRLCKRLIKQVSGISEQSVHRALRVRHAALHAALVHRDELRTATADSIRIVDQLATSTGVDRVSFWKDHLGLVDQIVNEHQVQVAGIVKAKVEAAKARIAKITSSLSPDLASAVLGQLSRKISYTDHEEAVVCPVCSQTAWLLCGVDKDKPEPGSEDGEWWVVHQTAWPFAFECSVCGLELDDNELLELDFPDSIELDPRFIPPPLGINDEILDE